MIENPYEPPLEESVAVESCPTPRFRFFSLGPVTGATVGVAHVVSMALIWIMHGCPDFFFRSAESAVMGAVVMGIGGSLFGLVYGGIVWAISRLLHLAPRHRLHFWAALVATLVITGIASELSLQRGAMVSPILVLALIVGVSSVAALVTARRTSSRSQ